MSDAPQLEHELDLALAAELQSALLPRACPTDCPNQVAAARNRMCRTIGGDFYDFIRINNEQAAVVIGDVVGHGVRSSLVMAQIMGFLRTSDPTKLSRPSDTIVMLNKMLLDLGARTETVLTSSVFYAVIDLPSGITFFVNAGHPRPFLCDREKCVVLPIGPKSMILGVDEFQPEEDCITFTPGQRMILYTDGLVDACNAENHRYGETRLHDAVNRHVADTPDKCADGIFQDVLEFRTNQRQIDDETLIVIDRR
ncbi:MAG: hypothetical protein EHM48_05305 [Planctomycetaceae bacterium]|nr:MAG: hypothetical protein EHM48_05305 [Planctomycetaceae bacterium]